MALRKDLILRSTVVCLDRVLRRVHGVRTFSGYETDILRISITTADKALTLPDGTARKRGDH